MHDQNNVFLAIALSVIILVAWQYFFATSFLHKEAGRKAPRIEPRLLIPDGITVSSCPKTTNICADLG